jgi:hypothetical protein
MTFRLVACCFVLLAGLAPLATPGLAQPTTPTPGPIAPDSSQAPVDDGAAASQPEEENAATGTAEAEATGQPVLDTDALDAELTALRDGLASAFNSGDVDQLLSYCHPEVIATWQNGAVAVGHDGVRDVVRQLVSGDSRVLASYAADPSVDHRLVLQDGTLVVSCGSLNDEYTLARDGGATVKLDSKWTVTVAKLDGRWQVLSFHVSCDAFDNEVITIFLQMTRYMWGALGGGIGAVMGVALGMYLGRRNAAGSTGQSGASGATGASGSKK